MRRTVAARREVGATRTFQLLAPERRHANPANSPGVRSYLYNFGSTSIAITAKGNVIVTANPAGCETAFWLKREAAKQLLAEARIRGDIEGSAKRQGGHPDAA
jgi:hypothetical protein